MEKKCSKKEKKSCRTVSISDTRFIYTLSSFLFILGIAFTWWKVSVLPPGTKTGKTTWESIVMTRRSWTHPVPSPPSLWEQLETSSSDTETLEENTAAVRSSPWSWSSLMEACSSWTRRPTPSGTTASALGRRFSLLASTSPLDASYLEMKSWTPDTSSAN